MPTGVPGKGAVPLVQPTGGGEPPVLVPVDEVELEPELELDEPVELDVLVVPARPVEVEVVPARPVEVEVVPARPVEVEVVPARPVAPEVVPAKPVVLVEVLELPAEALVEPLVDVPLVEEPLVEEPLVEEPAVEEPAVEELALVLEEAWPAFPCPAEPPAYIPIVRASCEGRSTPQTRPGTSIGSSAFVITNSFLPL